MKEMVSVNEVFELCERLHMRSEDFEDGDLSDRIYQYSTYIKEYVPLDLIDTDEWAWDQDYVDEYKNRDVSTMPPIVLEAPYHDRYTIIDGTHRANAMKQLGENKILALVGNK